MIKKWWSKYPDANIGIPTREKSGWLVLDIDTKYQGDESLEVLEMLYEDLLYVNKNNCAATPFKFGKPVDNIANILSYKYIIR